MLRATHFGCAIREVFLSYRHVAAPVGYDKRLSLALNILPRRLFLLLLFQVSLRIRKVDRLTYDYQAFNVIIAITR